MLTTIGLADLVAADSDEYVRIATALAGDTTRLAALHAGLRGMVESSPVCDGPAFTRSLETAYCGMWAAGS
jgi:predicted O-linked N-acetylglucosamine transferase (SPINDLY family)